MGDIITGIDKLVQLINRRNEISLEDAANELHVDKEVIEDWIEVLEAEKLIKVNYKFSSMFISSSKTTSQDMLKSAVHIGSQKDAFTRKIDATIHALENETTDFDTVRTKFIAIQKNVKSELKVVRKELNELKQFDNMRNNVDKDIIKSQKIFGKFVKIYNDQLDVFDKKYVSLVHNLKLEQVKLEKHAKSVEEFKKAKNEIEQTIHHSLAELKKTTDSFTAESKKIFTSEKRIRELTSSIHDLSSNIQDKKVFVLKNLNKKIGISLPKINAKQDELLMNAKIKKDEIQNYSQTAHMIYKSFNTLFENKITTAEMIEGIETERQALMKELYILKEKVLLFSIKRKDPDMKKKIKEMEKTIDSYEKKKKFFALKIDKLMKYIRHH